MLVNPDGIFSISALTFLLLFHLLALGCEFIRYVQIKLIKFKKHPNLLTY